MANLTPTLSVDQADLLRMIEDDGPVRFDTLTPSQRRLAHRLRGKGMVRVRNHGYVATRDGRDWLTDNTEARGARR